MRMASLTRSLSSLAPLLIAVILVGLPFHAFLTVWFSQFIGHYALLRLWKELLLLPICAGVAYGVYRHPEIGTRFLKSRLMLLITVYIVVALVWGAVAYGRGQVSRTALAYGILSDLRYLFFFVIVALAAAMAPWLHAKWRPLIFWPLAVVTGIGLLQYFVLPYDVLRHFGYSAATIFPYEDINSNLHYIRVMSTLRGANPLGAYLVAVVSLLLAWRQKRVWWYILLGISLVVLVLTFSRSAWIGVLAAAVVIGIARYVRFIRINSSLVLWCVVAVAILCGTVVGVSRSTAFQNVFLHTQVHSAVATTSNQGHATALEQGIHDVLHEPLGRGPGTAGPASTYNTGHPVRIAENYFIQIAQEMGWLGLFLFVAVQCFIGAMLWRQRKDPLALGLCAGLIGVSLVGLFSHVWADDTLSYIWWGLAGIVLAPVLGPKEMTQSASTRTA